MKTHNNIVAALFCATAIHTATAATVQFRPEGSRPAAGVPYDWVVQMSSSDTASFSRHVGAWSWEDNSLFDVGEPSVGWTHTSDWLKLLLTGDTTLTFRFERQTDVPGASPTSPSMFPSFTLWSGWDVDGAQDHTYNNNNNSGPIWAESLTYITHVDNSTETAVERTWTLPAGAYTMALGSNAPATDTNRQGYLATLTTVPEPSTSLLALMSLGILRRRRRA